LAPIEVTEQLEVTLSVMAAEESQNRRSSLRSFGCLAKTASNERFSYTGKLISLDMTEADVQKSGNFLNINDAVVKRLMWHKTLFDYDVKLAKKSKTE
jgi:hypothetical protein